MKKKSTRLTLATTLGLALLFLLVLNDSMTSTWAFDQAIEAIRKYRAVHTMGRQGGVPIEVWARADSTGTRSDECLARSADFVAWVKDNRTYSYVADLNKVFVDNAITLGMNPWFGPKLLATLSKVPDCRTVEGTDPATGRKRVLMTCSLQTATGPQSLLIEFDAGTKLPVNLKMWNNVDRRGMPIVSTEKIVFFEDLPNSFFAVDVPEGVEFVEKELAIPEANVPLLGNPKDGISAEGLGREAACREILGEFWGAAMANDFARIRELCPIAVSWSDELLSEIAQQDDVVEVLQIGDIEKEGRSKLGPIALVPSRVRCRDGKTREIKMVVQFRQDPQGASCVIHGPYGYSVEVNPPGEGSEGEK